MLTCLMRLSVITYCHAESAGTLDTENSLFERPFGPKSLCAVFLIATWAKFRGGETDGKVFIATCFNSAHGTLKHQFLNRTRQFSCLNHGHL